jgi:hypothetical protein
MGVRAGRRIPGVFQRTDHGAFHAGRACSQSRTAARSASVAEPLP